MTTYNRSPAAVQLVRDRQALGLRQNAVAAQLGVIPRTIWRLEHGLIPPGSPTGLRYRALLDAARGDD